MDNIHVCIRVELWAKALPDDQVAVLLLNPSDANVTVRVKIADVIPGKPMGLSYRDVWEHKDVAITATVSACTLRLVLVYVLCCALHNCCKTGPLQ